VSCDADTCDHGAVQYELLRRRVAGYPSSTVSSASAGPSSARKSR
jgi:hypothetical protein